MKTAYASARVEWQKPAGCTFHGSPFTHAAVAKRHGIQLQCEVVNHWGLLMNLPEFLVQDADGTVFVTGHRVGLLHVVDLYSERFSPDEILEYFPTLSLSVIHRTIAFYLDNRSEVDAYRSRCRAEIDRQAGVPQPGPDRGELTRRMESLRRAESA